MSAPILRLRSTALVTDLGLRWLASERKPSIASSSPILVAEGQYTSSVRTPLRYRRAPSFWCLAASLNIWSSIRTSVAPSSLPALANNSPRPAAPVERRSRKAALTSGCSAHLVTLVSTSGAFRYLEVRSSLLRVAVSKAFSNLRPMMPPTLLATTSLTGRTVRPNQLATSPSPS